MVSSTSSGSLSAYLSEIAQSRTADYCQLSANLIILYDYLITFGAEVDEIWASKRKTNCATIIFFVNRYNMLIQAIFWVVEYFVKWSSIKVCILFQIQPFISQLVFYLSWTTFSALRVSIFSRRGNRLTLLVLALGLVPFGTTIYSCTSQILWTSLSENECINDWNPPVALSDTCEIATRISLIFSDIIVLYATLSSCRTRARSPLKKLLIIDVFISPFYSQLTAYRWCCS
ncbi:hypothetical protein CERSUDRAFT_115898 [Gelatoporia subvermispora B]|uniref:DUF6533 domain-containing protein n=1 Tax=Ceriporiopsis subvermispora (strain B) TaxID=914234 RepID=M2QFZ3_CERS8|nr:hypothetical protein CERSUDRAFT_115898 [Gelatoporia subvermispora B]